MYICVDLKTKKQTGEQNLKGVGNKTDVIWEQKWDYLRKHRRKSAQTNTSDMCEATEGVGGISRKYDTYM